MQFNFRHFEKNFPLEVEPDTKVSTVLQEVEESLSLIKDSVDLSLDGEVLNAETQICETEITSDSTIDVVFKESYEKYLDAKRLIPDFNVEYAIKDPNMSTKIMFITEGYINAFFCKKDILDAICNVRRDIRAKEIADLVFNNFEERLHALIKLMVSYKYFSLLNRFLYDSTKNTIVYDIILQSVSNEDARNLNFDAKMLFRAVEENNLSLAEKLLEMGFDVDHQNGSNQTPLYVASKNGFFEMVELRLKYFPNINSRTTKNSTPLITASYNNRSDVVKILLENGADVNIIDDDNDTALTSAISKGHVSIAAEILKKNPIVHESVDSPFYRSMNNRILNDLCLKYKQYRDTDIFHAYCYRDTRAFKDLLSREDFSQKVKDQNGYSVIVRLVKDQDFDFINAYIESGLDLNIQDSNGYSAFWHAFDYESNLHSDYDSDYDSDDEKITHLLFRTGQKLKMEQSLYEYIRNNNEDLSGYQSLTIDDLTSLKDINDEDYIDFLIENFDQDDYSLIEIAIENNQRFFFERLIEQKIEIDINELNSKCVINHVKDPVILRELIKLDIKIDDLTIESVIENLVDVGDIETIKELLTKINYQFPINRKLYNIALDGLDKKLLSLLIEKDCNFED